MNDEELWSRVTGLIGKTLSIDGSILVPETSIEDLCEDSIQIFSLIMAFEHEFGTKVRYEDLIRIETVGDIMTFIRKSEA